jgi:hypothetical protein
LFDQTRPIPAQNKVETLGSTATGLKTDAITRARYDGPREQKVGPSEPTQPARRGIADLHRVPRPSADSEDLSPKEIELLWNATKDPRGEILHSRTLDGEGIRANGSHFLKDADARTGAEWLGALRSLDDRGFIEPLSDDSDFFKVTADGYAAADQLQEFVRWSAHSIVLRAYYLNAETQEHTLTCRGIVAIPACYYSDQIGADRSIQRSLKEPRSVLVEGIASRPSFNWEPNEIEFIDNENGQVQKFKVEGMEFIPPASLKPPIVG